MRRSNAVEVVVESPDRGLITSVPVPDKARNKAIVVAKNVRAEFGVLRNAPGYERILLNPSGLDSPANLIFQSNILSNDAEIRTTPIIGTAEKLYTVQRRAKDYACLADGFSCPLTAAFLGDSGIVGEELEDCANLIKSWRPDLIVHLGDMAYAAGGESSTINDYEECIGQYFHEYIGGYNGIYGVGPSENKFMPVLGNHDWDDAGLEDYLDFFQLPPNERYFAYKRGPVHFIHISGYSAEEPDGVTFDSVQGEWAQGILAASDCPWRIVVVHFPPYTSDSLYQPGITALRWPFADWGASAVVSGHAHNAEAILVDGVYYFVSGTGGQALRAFADPPVNGSLWRYNDDHGVLRLDATRKKLTWSFYKRDGTVLHSLEMTEPKESSGICYIGDAAKQVFTLEVLPATAAVEVGYQWPFEAFAHYEDGTTENVTLQSVWTSADESIATVSSTSGLSTGVSPGTVDITATFRGESDSGSLTVLHSCLDDAMEVVFVVERTQSMGSTSSGASRLQNVKDAITLALDGFNDENDFVSLVSFAGTYTDQTEDATTDQTLTDEFDLFEDRLAALSASGTGSSIPAALAAAQTELTSSRHSSERQRAVVLVVDGPGDVTDPGDTSTEAAAIAASMADALTTANALKALGVKIIVFGYAVPEAYKATLTMLATTGYAWFYTDAPGFKRDMALLANSFCMATDYYTGDCASAGLDFFNFVNWDVLRGCVDLVGRGSNGVAIYDVLPGNGLYVDLVGTDSDNGIGGDTEGKIATKTAFSFTSGKQYRLSFYLAGWNVPSPPTGTFTVLASIENVLAAKTITISDRLQPFTRYEYTFTAASTTTGRIIFDHQQSDPPTGTVGLLLDNVALMNVTDDQVMFVDNFDGPLDCLPELACAFDSYEVMSNYHWGVSVDLDPATQLDSTQRACTDAIFDIEIAEEIAYLTSIGYTVHSTGTKYWKYYSPGGTYKSGILKTGHCDPNDPAGETSVLFADNWVRAVELCVSPP